MITQTKQTHKKTTKKQEKHKEKKGENTTTSDIGRMNESTVLDSLVNCESNDEIMNEDRMKEICCGAPEVRKLLLSLFQTQTLESITTLKQASSESNDEVGKRLVHDIKGSAANVGFQRMASAADQLHVLIATDTFACEATIQALDSLIAAWEQTSEWISAELRLEDLSPAKSEVESECSALKRARTA